MREVYIAFKIVLKIWIAVLQRLFRPTLYLHAKKFYSKDKKFNSY